MGHAYWGMHMMWALRAPLRFVPKHVAQFSLGRMWQRSGCLAQACRGASCARSETVRRPWQPPLPTPPPLPRPSYAHGAEQTRRSCHSETWQCADSSRLCGEAAAAVEPMDRHHLRARWVQCAAEAKLCHARGLGPLSLRCAATMLRLWVDIWRDAPATNSTRLPLRGMSASEPPGVGVGGGGPAAARHESAALAYLVAQAATLGSAEGGAESRQDGLLRACPPAGNTTKPSINL